MSNTGIKTILYITTEKEWDNALKLGEYKAPSLKDEGFIHCSTTSQTVETANLFFQGREDLVLLCINK